MERIVIEIAEGQHALAGALLRYDLLERLARIATSRDIAILAFGMTGEELRLVVDGDHDDVTVMIRGVKSGTRRHAAKWVDLRWGALLRWELDANDLEDAVVWCHSAPVEAGASCPLASPWSSHRDLMGYRTAMFYDPGPLKAMVQRVVVHDRSGGLPLPEGWPPSDEDRPESLNTLLRVAAAIVGVLPADRRCFRLFAHLARAQGHTTGDTARALAMTPRRVRQLRAADEPLFSTGLAVLSDARLQRVP